MWTQSIICLFIGFFHGALSLDIFFPRHISYLLHVCMYWDPWCHLSYSPNSFSLPHFTYLAQMFSNGISNFFHFKKFLRMGIAMVFVKKQRQTKMLQVLPECQTQDSWPSLGHISLQSRIRKSTMAYFFLSNSPFF